MYEMKRGNEDKIGEMWRGRREEEDEKVRERWDRRRERSGKE